MKKLFIVLMILPFFFCFSCSEGYKKRTSDCWERIANSYVYSMQAFEYRINASKRLATELYLNPTKTDTLFALYQSLDDLVNFEAEHFCAGGDADINWYYLRDEFTKNIEKLKIDVSQNESRDGLTPNQYKSIIYRKFYTDLVKLEQSVSEKISREMGLISVYYRCP